MGKKNEADPQFEIAFYENVLKHSPNFIEALSALGDLYTKQGFYEKGLRVDERITLLRPEDAVAFYNLACSYSLMQDITGALTAMKRAIELGYNEFDYLQKDPDLTNLLCDTEFQMFFKEARGRSNPSRHKEGAV